MDLDYCHHTLQDISTASCIGPWPYMDFQPGDNEMIVCSKMSNKCNIFKVCKTSLLIFYIYLNLCHFPWHDPWRLVISTHIWLVSCSSFHWNLRFSLRRWVKPSVSPRRSWAWPSWLRGRPFPTSSPVWLWLVKAWETWLCPALWEATSSTSQWGEILSLLTEMSPPVQKASSCQIYGLGWRWLPTSEGPWVDLWVDRWVHLYSRCKYEQLLCSRTVAEQNWRRCVATCHVESSCVCCD